MKKNNKGVTMIEIVVVIIILILLAVIAIWNSQSSYIKAEGTNLLNEFKSIEEGAVMIETFFNTNADYTLEQGIHYCEERTDASGDTWYVLYGRDAVGQAWYDTQPNGSEMFKTIIGNWALDDLKRSYEVKFGKEIEIKYINGNYVELNNYKVYSYEDIKTLRESGAF